jgi:FKBP-type peptidyl-prolyl cis-trans isomerase
VPYGLWKAIEHMRRGEKALIAIKPKSAFGRPESEGLLKIPEEWDTPEKREILAKRRVYYEVKLHDWLVKHDLDGDGLVVKTILDKGVGYDRPFDYDEIKVDLKVYQVDLATGAERVYQSY